MTPHLATRHPSPQTLICPTETLWLVGSVPLRPSCVTVVSTLPDSNTDCLTSSQLINVPVFKTFFWLITNTLDFFIQGFQFHLRTLWSIPAAVFSVKTSLTSSFELVNCSFEIRTKSFRTASSNFASWFSFIFNGLENSRMGSNRMLNFELAAMSL